MSTVQTQDPQQIVRDYAAYLDGDTSKEYVFSQGFRSFQPGSPPEGLRGIEAYREALRGFAQGFPDLQHRIDSIAVDGDVVLTEWTVVGTHKGEFAGVPASNKRVTMKTAGAYVVRDGKIVEERAYFNVADLMAQIAGE